MTTGSVGDGPQFGTATSRPRWAPGAGVQVHVTPGAGHGLPFQFPDGTVDRVSAVIDEVESA